MTSQLGQRLSASISHTGFSLGAILGRVKLDYQKAEEEASRDDVGADAAAAAAAGQKAEKAAFQPTWVGEPLDVKVIGFLNKILCMRR